MQSVTIEKGQHLVLNVREVESVASKNPSWDSRWKITGMAYNGSEVSTFIGNKALMQQLGRKGMESPNELVGKDWTFERTAEGYLNVLGVREKAKTEHLPLSDAPVAKPVPKPVAAMPFDEPVEGEADAASAVAAKVDQIREERRQRVGEDIAWAVGQADSFVTQILANHNIEYTTEALRSVAALAATIHISYKESR